MEKFLSADLVVINSNLLSSLQVMEITEQPGLVFLCVWCWLWLHCDVWIFIVEIHNDGNRVLLTQDIVRINIDEGLPYSGTENLHACVT